MDFAASLFVGILGGVASTALGAISVNIWNENLYPKLRAMRYSGLIVSGSWDSNSDFLMQKMHLDIIQMADSIEGTATFVSEDKSNTDHEEIRTFKMTGYIKDGMIVLNSNAEKRNRLGIHTFLLKACGDGRELEGVMGYYSIRGTTRGKIMCDEVKFRHESLNPDYLIDELRVMLDAENEDVEGENGDDANEAENEAEETFVK